MSSDCRLQIADCRLKTQGFLSISGALRWRCAARVSDPAAAPLPRSARVSDPAARPCRAARVSDPAARPLLQPCPAWQSAGRMVVEVTAMIELTEQQQ